ncbi:helix-turn-helix domain-containing protein [Agrococcus sp. UYP33]
MDEPEQDVLRADVVVVEQLRLFLGEHHDAASAVGESLEHRWLPSLTASVVAGVLARGRVRCRRDTGGRLRAVAAIRFSTLIALCDALDCQPGDLFAVDTHRTQKRPR